MPSRKVEEFFPDAFKIGEGYTRHQIAALGKVAALANPREWGGLVEFSNEIHIYVTLHKTRNEPEHMYKDRIEGDVVFWDSRAKHTPNSLQVRKLLANDKPIRFFCRLTDREPFVHGGLLKYISHSGSEPVAFHWKLLSYGDLASSLDFIRLASWTPEGLAISISTIDIVVLQQSAFREGKASEILVNRYERDPRAREACLKYHGYKCWVCDFDFVATYGSLGEHFAFVHHRSPVARRAVDGPYEVDPRNDLIPICGNCHAIVHRLMKSEQAAIRGNLQELSWRRLLLLRAEVRLEPWDQL